MSSLIRLATLAVATALAAGPAFASQLVVNGGFESTTLGSNRQPGYNTELTGWTVSGYNFVFSDIGATAVGTYGGLSLWGPATGGGNNGAANSPTGGNFYAADGAFGVGPLRQVLKGLTAGDYTLSFDWAAAQQTGFSGANTEQWEVKLGGAAAQTTAVYQNSSHGFGGWWHETMTFNVAAGDAMLSFMAKGTPQGVPPFSLLDSVSVTAASSVPEPQTLGLVLTALGLLYLLGRRQRGNGQA